MTATDELRRMLDERGVEWVDTGDGSTFIPEQTATDVAWDVNTWPSGKDMGDCLWVQNRHPLTPEQAIESTLGRGTCVPVLDSERDNQPYLSPVFVCSECGCRLTEHRCGKVWQNYCPNCGRKVVYE